LSHWRTYLESDVIRFVDLDSKEYTLKIASIKRGKVVGTGGKSTGKALIYFEGREKPLGCGTAILSQIAAIYGNDTKQWVGKEITIYPDPSVKYGGQAVGGVRAKAPPAPKDSARG
jgi:hypothetical protein